MSEKKIPQALDWDHFWNREQQTPESISWSKRRMIKVIEPYMKDSKTALDAGCGSGFFSKYFCDQGLQTTALDFSQEALERTRQRTQSRTHIISYDLCQDGLSNHIPGGFDLIFTDGLLEHFPNDQQHKIINNLISVLPPKGVLVTFVPNRFSPWELIRPFFMPGIDETPFVLRHLICLQNDHRLTILQSGGINVLPFYVSHEFLGSWFGMLLYTAARKT